MSKKPLLSIITVNLNNLEGLKKTMTSVLEQTWKEFEFIIIDGGSTDGSEEFILKNGDKINYWVSEPDRGVYNAMNKGIKRATGKYVLFLNSGDEFCNSDVLTQIANSISGGKDIYYGNVYLINKDESELLEFPEQLSFGFFCISTITHQATFIKRSLFDDIFYYNENYKLVSDWEFFIFAICKENSSYEHLGIPVCNYDTNGLTSREANIQLMNKERREVLDKHFPLFMKDYMELFEARNKLGSQRVKDFSHLEKNPLAKRINSLMFRIFAR